MVKHLNLTNMVILFDTSFPKGLLNGLKEVHQIDEKKDFIIQHYDHTVDTKMIINPIVFLFDYSGKGIDVTTEGYFKAGYRVFVMKTKRRVKLDMYELALTVIKIWPEVLRKIEGCEKPFVYGYKYQSRKIKQLKET